MVSTYIADNIEKMERFVNEFSDLGMPRTALSLINLQIMIGNNTIKVSELESAYFDLTKNIKREYVGSDRHRKKCFSLMFGQLNNLISNPINYDKVLDEIIGILEKRKPTAKSWGISLKILLRKDLPTDQKLVGLSHEYATKVEGIYKADIRLCYILSKYSIGEPINYKKVAKTGINKIKGYFKEKFNNVCLFEGWNNHIRNAEAHASFYYDDKKEVMLYEDNYKNSRWKKELSYEELFDLSQKLMNVCELMDIILRIIMIRRFCLLNDLEKFRLLGIDVVALQ